jgi:[acyl-carrier-protein] S-malonyltransferase
MQRSGAERPGTMAALLGLDDEAVEAVCREASSEGGTCVPANYNSPGQLVISGDVPAVERAMELAKAAGARKAVRLNVSGAFHSPLMQVAEGGFRAQLESAVFAAPRFPVVSNVSAQPVTDPADARLLLVRQLTTPVRWTDSMRTMLESGIVRFAEIGPGSVLGGLLRRIERTVSCQPLGTVAEVEAFSP